MTHALARLRRLVERLRLPDLGEDGEQHAAALQQFLAGADFEAALGLQPGWRTRDRRERRDALLRELAQFYDGDRRPRASAMAVELKRYVGSAWRAERDLDELPGASPKRQLMHEVFRLDPETPTGWRQLFEIIGYDHLCSREGVATAQTTSDCDAANQKQDCDDL
jgi:hypothetical protein